MRMYADTILKEPTVYSKSQPTCKNSLCISKIDDSNQGLGGGSKQGWLQGGETCAVTQGLCYKKPMLGFLFCSHCLQIHKFRTRGISFSFCIGLHKLHSWVQIRSYWEWTGGKSPPAERNKNNSFDKEEALELRLVKWARFEQRCKW